MFKIGIIRESRTDDKRTPLVPKNVKSLLNKFNNTKIIVQPSETRCFSNDEYEKESAIIDENLSECDIILGVKEIEPNRLIPNKTYIFFSHTAKIQEDNSAVAQGTPGMDKKKLLNEIQSKNITLIDYENIRDNLSRRYLGFGRFAGIVGCYNSLNLYLLKTNQEQMPRAYELDSYEKLIENIKKKNFKNLKILVTGDGRVAKGVLEFLKLTNLKNITPKECISANNLSSYYCNLPTSKYVISKDNKQFDLQHFIRFPNLYKSQLGSYMQNINLLISSHYWDPKSPKLFEKKDLFNFKKLEVIGDITCDINGSIPTTIRSTTIKDPYFYLNIETFKEVEKNYNDLAIMAVDNLPSELPRDSSEEFGNGIVNHVLPYIIEQDDGRIKKATITYNGKFLPSYNYIRDYINKK